MTIIWTNWVISKDTNAPIAKAMISININNKIKKEYNIVKNK